MTSFSGNSHCWQENSRKPESLHPARQLLCRLGTHATMFMSSQDSLLTAFCVSGFVYVDVFRWTKWTMIMIFQVWSFFTFYLFVLFIQANNIGSNLNIPVPLLLISLILSGTFWNGRRAAGCSSIIVKTACPRYPWSQIFSKVKHKSILDICDMAFTTG